MKSRVILSRILFVLYLAAIALLLFIKSESLPTVTRTIFGFPTDKVAHFMMFLPFPILAFLSSNVVTRKYWHSLLLVSVILVTGAAIALMTEYIQGLTTYRTQDINDFKADVLALGITSLLVLAVDLANLPKSRKKK